MSDTTVGDRIKARRKKLRLSQAKLAELSGLEQPTISALERNKAATTRSVASLAYALQVNALWLEKGVGDPEASLEGEAIQPAVEVSDRTGRELEYEIEVVDSRGSCGGGDPSKRDVDEIIRTMAPVVKDPSFFAHLGVEPSDVKAIIADGDGMANFIVHGDTVLVSTAHCDRLVNGHIYAISTPSGIHLKRVILRSDGHLILSFDRSDKDRYPTEEYSPEQVKTLSVFGRFLYRQG